MHPRSDLNPQHRGTSVGNIHCAGAAVGVGAIGNRIGALDGVTG